MSETLALTVVGHVESPVREPRDERWGAVESTLRLLPDFADGLRGLDGFTHALVVTWLHGARYERSRHLLRHPRGRVDLPRVGIFAQRAKDRPSPLGITAVEIVAVEPPLLRVRGLDAIDGTPVVDVKPYVPAYDRVRDATVPAWMHEVMRGYFVDEEPEPAVRGLGEPQVPGDALAQLEGTPAVLERLLAGTPPALHAVPERPGAWSALDVVRHLIAADETSFVPRVRRVLDEDPRPFAPADPLGYPPRFAGRPVEDVLGELAAVRARSLATVRGWDLAAALERRGAHPLLGAVTLRQLLATWAAHDLTHLAQATRVLAGRWRELVGPWRQLLPLVDA